MNYRHPNLAIGLFLIAMSIAACEGPVQETISKNPCPESNLPISSVLLEDKSAFPSLNREIQSPTIRDVLGEQTMLVLCGTTSDLPADYFLYRDSDSGKVKLGFLALKDYKDQEIAIDKGDQGIEQDDKWAYKIYNYPDDLPNPGSIFIAKPTGVFGVKFSQEVISPTISLKVGQKWTRGGRIENLK